MGNVLDLRICRGHNDEVWGTLSPAGSRGRAAVGGLGDEVSQKLKLFWKYTVKNAHFVTITLHLNNCIVKINAQFAKYPSKMTDNAM